MGGGGVVMDLGSLKSLKVWYDSCWVRYGPAAYSAGVLHTSCCSCSFASCWISVGLCPDAGLMMSQDL